MLERTLSKLGRTSVLPGIFTARKRSLRRLCFYRCLSVHRGGVLGCSRGGRAWLLPRGVRGCSGGGMRGCSRGGVHGCSWGGRAWLLWGACVVAPGGVRGCSAGACVVAPGGHAWLHRGGGVCVVFSMRYGQ